VGYEALTRFEDGRSPDVVFAEAEAVGLGLDLETATLERTFEAVEGLAFGAILSVNVSPELIVSGRLASLLPSWRERLVLEVTEHVAIDDYPAMRAAIDALRPVSLAIDDAGAGFASLRHIIELEPDFVKLDISLVRGIDADPARQGLVAGMAYFATRTDRTLIAEGIETTEERDALRALGVVLGQGYLLGRPAALGRGARSGPGRTRGATRQAGASG
jgi:EAL domain-containing protein (putative c-di-GMP-specific phosphodiesterase class I)